MRKNFYTLSVILLLFQSHAAEYEFVSAAPRLAATERMKLGTVAVLAVGEPAQYGFQKSKGRAGTAADGAADGALAALEGGVSSGEPLAAAGSIALSPLAAVVGAISVGTRKVAPDALAESEAELTEGLVEMAAQNKMREQLLKVAREKSAAPWSFARMYQTLWTTTVLCAPKEWTQCSKPPSRSFA